MLLNLARYVDTFEEEEEEVDIAAVQERIDGLEKDLSEVRKEMKARLKELRL